MFHITRQLRNHPSYFCLIFVLFFIKYPIQIEKNITDHGGVIYFTYFAIYHLYTLPLPKNIGLKILYLHKQKCRSNNLELKNQYKK